VWGHVTTPFTTAAQYDAAIETYYKKLSEGYDSLISVMPFKNFLLNPTDSRIFNITQASGKWPRTQDLPLLYEVNHAMFMASRDVYIHQHDRIGSKPFLYEQDKIQSFDIDWEDDFVIAEAIYDKLYSA
jgi:N-acylneuraminate cytidylyltransferase